MLTTPFFKHMFSPVVERVSEVFETLSEVAPRIRTVR
jgi:hypothetical protein